MADTTQPSYFVKNLVGHLLPHFTTYKFEPAELTKDILNTLTSTGARTRLELLFATLTIAFGFAALETLTEAKESQDLTPALKGRYRACATSLNRACQQNANALAARLNCDRPAAKPQPAKPLPATTEPVNDLSDEEAHRILRQAKATIESCRNRLAQPATPGSAPSRNNPFSHLFSAPG